MRSSTCTLPSITLRVHGCFNSSLPLCHHKQPPATQLGDHHHLTSCPGTAYIPLYISARAARNAYMGVLAAEKPNICYQCAGRRITDNLINKITCQESITKFVHVLKEDHFENGGLFYTQHAWWKRIREAYWWVKVDKREDHLARAGIPVYSIYCTKQLETIMVVINAEIDVGSWLSANAALNSVLVFAVTLLTAWIVFMLLSKVITTVCTLYMAIGIQCGRCISTYDHLISLADV